MVYTIQTPNPSNRYKPKSDTAILQNLIRKEWAKRVEDFRKSDGEVVLAVVERLKTLFPYEDMKLLQRYDAAHAVSEVVITIYNHKTERWDTSYRLELPSPLLVPSQMPLLTACHPDWWDSPDLGINPDYRLKMSSDEWRKAVEDNEESKRFNFSNLRFFEEYLALSEGYHSDLRITNWIKSYRDTNGKYPTWGEIADHTIILSP